MMIEQMVETRAWKAARGLIEGGRCRICFSHVETVEHQVAGCRGRKHYEVANDTWVGSGDTHQ